MKRALNRTFLKDLNMTKFEDFGLEPRLLKSLSMMNYTEPTPVQAKTIPFALDGRDVLGSAQTGTGKTAAFAIPMLNALLNSDEGIGLVLTPTRELGKQVMEAIREMLGPKSGIQTAFIIGGEPMRPQFAQLERNPRIIVGTPGRINDHLKRGSLNLEDTRFLVLDETDRMLDMGFSIQLDEIEKHMSGERQTLMFSATMPNNIMRMADRYLNNPERIEIGEANTAAKNIQQDVMFVQRDKKYKTLLHELSVREGTIIVFSNTKRETEALAKKLKADGVSADAIHGDLRQHKREKIIKKLRAEQFRVLVATDVVARGLDIPHIAHVINYDLPMMPEDYIHRIGRTARAGAKGHALCLISPHDGRRWAAIQRLIDPKSKEDKGNYGERPSRGKSGGGYGGKSNSYKGGGKKYGNNDNYGGKKKSFRRDEGRSFDKRDDRGSFEGRKPFKRDNERSFDKRDDRSYGGGKPSFQKRDDRPSEGRSSGFQKRDDRGSFEGRKPFKRDNERSFDKRDDRSYGGGKPSFQKRDDRGSFEGRKPFKRDDERSFDDRKSSFKKRDDRPSDGRSSGFKKRDDRGSFEGRKPFKRDDERSFDDRKSSFKKRDDRPSDGRSSGFKKRDDRPSEGRKSRSHEDGFQSYGDKPVKRKKPMDNAGFSGKKKKKMQNSMSQKTLRMNKAA
jgi:ATP-dependent RNA helicase DeaD